LTLTSYEKLGEMHLLGVEDGSFNAFSREADSYTVLCCTAMTRSRIQDVRISQIEVDGFDATEKLFGMLQGVDVDVVVLGGITFAGFNIIDPSSILNEVGIPVIVYSGEEPDNDAMRFALRKHFEDWRMRWSIIEGLGDVFEAVVRPGEPPVYFEVVGDSQEWAEAILRSSALVCRIPEPVRVAGLIARGVSRPTC